MLGSKKLTASILLRCTCRPLSLSFCSPRLILALGQAPDDGHILCKSAGLAAICRGGIPDVAACRAPVMAPDFCPLRESESWSSHPTHHFHTRHVTRCLHGLCLPACALWHACEEKHQGVTTLGKISFFLGLLTPLCAALCGGLPALVNIASFLRAPCLAVRRRRRQWKHRCSKWQG